jgi:hypothetical protein
MCALARGIGAAAWLLALAIGCALVMAMSAGCGASALQIHATAADISGVAIDAAGEQLVEARGAALERAAAAPAREDAQQAVDAVSLRWAPLVASYDALRLTHDSYVEALTLAAAADLDDPMRWAALAARLVRAWDSWATAAEALGMRSAVHPPGVLLAVASLALPASPAPAEPAASQ